MNTIKLIKSKKPGFWYWLFTWLFILTGANFYMNWILPTNSQSKNPLWRVTFFWANKFNGNPFYRLLFALITGTGHGTFMILNAFAGSMWSPGNILINIYPTIVQLYMGYRSFRIINHRRIKNAPSEKPLKYTLQRVAAGFIEG